MGFLSPTPWWTDFTNGYLVSFSTSNGFFEWVPNTNFVGTDSFTFTVSNGYYAKHPRPLRSLLWTRHRSAQGLPHSTLMTASIQSLAR